MIAALVYDKRGVGRSGGEYEGEQNVSGPNIQLLADDAAAALATLAGPVCKVSEEDIFSKHTADGDSERVPTYAEALGARKTPYRWPDFLGRDTDAAEDLAKLKIPGLWIFGDRDGSIPVDLSVGKLRALAAGGHRYEYRVFEGLGHENIGSTLDTVVEWIRRQGE